MAEAAKTKRQLDLELNDAKGAREALSRSVENAVMLYEESGDTAHREKASRIATELASAWMTEADARRAVKVGQ